MSGESGTLGPCPLCGHDIVPYGAFAQLFVVPDLGGPMGGKTICVDCARTVIPSDVAMAEALEHPPPRPDPKRGP